MGEADHDKGGRRMKERWMGKAFCSDGQVTVLPPLQKHFSYVLFLVYLPLQNTSQEENDSDGHLAGGTRAAKPISV